MNRGELSFERPRLAALGEEIATSFSADSANSVWLEEMLARLVGAVEAEGAALWTRTESGDRLQQACVIGPGCWSDSMVPEVTVPPEADEAVLRGEVVTEPPTFDPEDDVTALRGMFLPLFARGVAQGVVQLSWSADPPGPTRVKLLPLFDHMAPSPPAALDAAAPDSEATTTFAVSVPVPYQGAPTLAMTNGQSHAPESWHDSGQTVPATAHDTGILVKLQSSPNHEVERAGAVSDGRR
jgi:hypothetical protein